MFNYEAVYRAATKKDDPTKRRPMARIAQGMAEPIGAFLLGCGFMVSSLGSGPLQVPAMFLLILAGVVCLGISLEAP